MKKVIFVLSFLSLTACTTSTVYSNFSSENNGFYDRVVQRDLTIPHVEKDLTKNKISTNSGLRKRNLWTASKSEPLKEVFTRWASKSNYQVQWDIVNEVVNIMPSNFRMLSTFEGAAKKLLDTQYSDAISYQIDYKSKNIKIENKKSN